MYPLRLRILLVIADRSLAAACLTLLAFLGPATFADENRRAEPLRPVLAPVRLGDAVGYVDEHGKTAIPAQFAYADEFSEGLAAVRFEGEIQGGLEKSRWGYISPEGEFKIPPQFDVANSFSDGMAVVGMRAGLFYKFGYVDKRGRQIECRYDMAEPFEDGVARVSTATWIGAFVIRIADVSCTCNHDYISRTGQSISKSPVSLRYPVPLLIGETYHDGMQARGRVIYVLGNGKHAFDVEFDDGLRFREGLAAVQSKGKWGFIDPSGRFVIKPQFDGADSFSGGIAVVWQKKVRSYIDLQGHPRNLGSFEDVRSFSDGLAAAQIRGRWGYIRPDGTWAIDPQYVSANPFQRGIAKVGLDRRYWFINRNGERLGVAP